MRDDEMTPWDIIDLNYNENKKGKKKGGGKRMTKAERLALKAAMEAEEKLRLEMEERERLERERIETEERAERETLERERRDRDLPELHAIYDTMEAKLLQIQETRDEQRQWSRYMRSDGSPDPSLLGQINTFLNINRNSTEKPTFDETRNNVVLMLSLIEELELILAEKSTKAGTTKIIDELKTTKDSLISLLQYSLDSFTHALLCDSTDDADKETRNALTSLNGDVFSLNCWANLSCNPRLHTQTFYDPTCAVTLEVPRPLTIIPCGVRFMRTDFDHLSTTSPANALRFKVPGEGDIPILEGAVVDGEGEARASASTVVTAAPAAPALPPPPPPSPAQLAIEAANADLDLMEMPTTEFDDCQLADDVVDLRVFDLVGGVFHFDLIQMPPQVKEVREWRIREIEDPPIQLLTYEKDLPKAKASVSTIKSEEEKQSASSAEEANLNRARSPTSRTSGRTSHLKRTSRKRPTEDSGRLRNRDTFDSGKSKERQQSQQQQRYLDANRNQQLTLATRTKAKSQVSILSQASHLSKISEKPQINPPFGLSLSIPTDCAMYEEPVVALWDQQDKVWRKSDFDEVTYDQVTKTVTLSTYKFGALGCFQDRHINFPMTGWELRPLSNSSALLTINAAKVDVQIEISGNKCCLREPSGCPPFAGILGDWLTPKSLIHLMRSRGLNIFPYEDSIKHVKDAYKKKWMQEHKSELWGLFLFPEEFDVPEEEPEKEEEDDFFSFLKKPAEESEPEPEPEPRKKGKKGKRGKSNNRNTNQDAGDNRQEGQDDHDYPGQTGPIAEGQGKGKQGQDGQGKEGHRVRIADELEQQESEVDLNLHSVSSRNANAARRGSTPSRKRGGKRKRKEPKPKPPQQILWDNFNAWLLQHRIKHPDVIASLHREMALVAHVLAFSSSKWNLDAGETKLIVRAAEVTPEHTVAEDAWNNYMVTWKRVMPLRVKDTDKLFSEDFKDGGIGPVMSNLYHMAKQVGSESLKRRLQSVDFEFVETLREILDATQLFVFA